MDVSFIPGPTDPHGPARDALDDVLSSGTTRIMVACAFFSAAGCAIMRRHLARLQAPGSCLVVSADPPTNIGALNGLAREAPGKVWAYQTGKLPTEKKVGHALMHSKVFYAEAGENCRLWVGSHNLTGRATTGANLEAALVLTGHRSEAPFEAARQHIETCRADASECPVEPPPEPDGEGVDVVLIHAEADELPRDPFPWFARLYLASAAYDWSLSAPANLRMYLYRPGHLDRGWQSAAPWATYGGTLTGLNFTDKHPTVPGRSATWDEKDYSITGAHSALHFSRSHPEVHGIVTQATITVESLAPSEEVFLPAKPKVGQEVQIEQRLVGRMDEDLEGFFTRPSVRDGHLVYEVCHRGRATWQMSVGDLRESDRRRLFEDADESQVELLDRLEETRERHPLIMRAKYRLRGRPDRGPIL